MRTLEFYIQEVAAQLFTRSLPPQTRETVQILGSNLCLVLTDMFPKEMEKFATQESRVG